MNGSRMSRDPELIMKNTLGGLVEEYNRESYITYPIGFMKTVTLDKEDDERVGEILEEATGIATREEAEKVIKEWYTSQRETLDQEGKTVESMAMGPMEALQAEPLGNLTYERFGELMDEADKILGGGSDYGKEERENRAR